MLRRILVIQLLTVLLDPQGADPTSLAEAFPDDFTPDLDDSDQTDDTVVLKGASPSLSEAFRFLVDRHLVTIGADGRVVAVQDPIEVIEADVPFSPAEREEGFGLRPICEWGSGPGSLELGEPFGFDQVRLEA